jgi:AcrR family transcriptional regulator
MVLPLQPHFSFSQFKQVVPLDEARLPEFIIERNAGHITVKRPKAAVENLSRIFESTFRLANQRGFAAMTLRDLCRDTELSMGGLYGYIASKEDLAAMIEDVVRYIGAALPAWFASQPTAILRLDAILRGHIFVSELLHPWFYFVFMESRMLPASQKSVARTAELQLQQELQNLVVEADLAAPEQAALVAAHLQALVQDWYVKRWKYKAQRVSVDAFADSVSRMVLGKLQVS